ncbi:MAG: glycoside hydrolase family 31 protein, partial [Prevotella sp.]|nr:glycoside hydrolase family 31 protein [Prevotella sp.]
MNTILKQDLALLFALLLATDVLAYDIQLKSGTLTLTPMADNAVRVQYHNAQTHELPEWVYRPSSDKVKCKIKRSSRFVMLSLKRLMLTVSLPDGLIRAVDAAGKEIFNESAYQLTPSSTQADLGQAATLSFKTPANEALFGLGQFQDGYLNIRGLSRRLTQVNTQISIPMIISNRGYGLLWNNYGLTEYNPGDHHIALQKTDAEGHTLVVDQTSTHGNQREQRQSNTFEAQLSIAEEGDYAILLDVGQPMARRHQLLIDNDTVLNMMNIWLPPTASTIVHLKPGQHQVVSNAEYSDKPSIYYRKVNDTTTFYSPVAECVDFTLFTGSADEVIASYRDLTGKAPMMPLWALGYIHCRERFHSSDEIIQTARQFRQLKYPIDMIVQDWQYWGPNGWNAMTFDKAN